MTTRESTKRKRQACGELRELAAQTSVEAPHQNHEYRAEQFRNLTALVQQQGLSADQQRRLNDAIDLYFSREAAAPSAPAPAAPQAAPARAPFRCKIRLGFAGRCKQVEAVMAQEKLQHFQSERQAVLQRLAPSMQPFKESVMAALQVWADQYQHTQLRYKFCILRAPSRYGKSTLAKSLHDIFGWNCPFIQTVQDEPFADLRAFDRNRHGYILFDNLNNVDFILTQRALLQANPDIHSLGQSKTGMYAYTVWLHGVPIIFTMDHSADLDPSEPWLAENMMLVDLPEPCFAEAAAGQGDLC
eukprot:s1374_g13.t1